MATDVPTTTAGSIVHQEWLAQEIERGVRAADRGELIPDNTIAAWIKTLDCSRPF